MENRPDIPPGTLLAGLVRMLSVIALYYKVHASVKDRRTTRHRMWELEKRSPEAAVNTRMKATRLTQEELLVVRDRLRKMSDAQLIRQCEAGLQMCQLDLEKRPPSALFVQQLVHGGDFLSDHRRTLTQCDSLLVSGLGGGGILKARGVFRSAQSIHTGMPLS